MRQSNSSPESTEHCRSASGGANASQCDPRASTRQASETRSSCLQSCTHIAHMDCGVEDSFGYRTANSEWSEEVGTALSQIRPNGRYQCDKWLTAMWMVVNCKNGVSSWEIHRALGVTQKTAWFLDHRIRFMLGDEYETMQHNRKSSAIL